MLFKCQFAFGVIVHLLNQFALFPFPAVAPFCHSNVRHSVTAIVTSVTSGYMDMYVRTCMYVFVTPRSVFVHTIAEMDALGSPLWIWYRWASAGSDGDESSDESSDEEHSSCGVEVAEELFEIRGRPRDRAAVGTCSEFLWDTPNKSSYKSSFRRPFPGLYYR